MAKLEKIPTPDQLRKINESQDTTIIFTDKKDYDEFKENLKENDGMDCITKDYGDDGTGWTLNVDSDKLEKFYDFDWVNAVKGDYPSAVIS